MIRVNDEFVIDVDESNYVVKRDTHRKRATRDKTALEDVYVTCGYYSRLDSALEGVRNEMIKNKLKSCDKSLEEAVSDIKIANAELNKAIKKIVSGKS